ncbi:MAG: bifunctional DNA primase/polymerase [Dehalococcoidia bacterium]|nr:bifunctional DNA primase/polymerase [Dehalococcoidia bacterium]
MVTTYKSSFVDALVTDPHAPTLEYLKDAYPGIATKILELASSPSGPGLTVTRDEGSWTLSWTMHSRNVPIEKAEELLQVFHALMAQPARDEFTWPTALEKLYRAYEGNGSNRPRLQVEPDKPFSFEAVPFELPWSDPRDPERISNLWQRGIAAIPVAFGAKGAAAMLPKWKHLQDEQPTEKDWRKWGFSRFRIANTALLFGHGGAGMVKLYDIEIEDFQEYWARPDRDFWLANTIVYKSKKSAHILIMSDEVVPSTRAEGRFEFRGHGSYSLAPGSIHPDSTEELPIRYEQINDSTRTILKVTNVPAFVHHYFPALFAKQFEIASEVAAVERETGKPLDGETGKPLDGETVIAIIHYMQWKALRKRAKRENVEFVHIPVYMDKLHISHEDARDYPRGKVASRAIRASLQRDLTLDEDDPRAVAMERCGFIKSRMCQTHGERKKQPNYCKDPTCPDCGTKTTERLATMEMPDLTGDTYYTQYQFAWKVSHPGQSWMDQGNTIKAETQWWGKQVANLSRPGALLDKLLYRSVALSIGPIGDKSMILGRVMILEEGKGEAAKYAAKLIKRMEERSGMTVSSDVNSTQSGDMCVVQAMENSSLHILSLAAESPEYWQIAKDSLKGVRMFQSYGEFRRVEDQAQEAIEKRREEEGEEDVTICGECGKPLFIHLHHPDEPADFAKAVPILRGKKFYEKQRANSASGGYRKARRKRS